MALSDIINRIKANIGSSGNPSYSPQANSQGQARIRNAIDKIIGKAASNDNPAYQMSAQPSGQRQGMSANFNIEQPELKAGKGSGSFGDEEEEKIKAFKNKKRIEQESTLGGKMAAVASDLVPNALGYNVGYNDTDAFATNGGGYIGGWKNLNPVETAIHNLNPTGNADVDQFIEDMIGYIGPVAAHDIMNPNWAYNPQEDAEGSRKNTNVLGAPKTIAENGEYLADPWSIAVASADQRADQTEKQSMLYDQATAEGLDRSAAVALSALSSGTGPGIKGLSSPVLERSAMGEASKRANDAGAIGGWSAWQAAKNGEVAGLNGTSPYQLRDTGLRELLREIPWSSESKASQRVWPKRQLSEAQNAVQEEQIAKAANASGKAAAKFNPAEFKAGENLGSTSEPSLNAAAQMAANASSPAATAGNKVAQAVRNVTGETPPKVPYTPVDPVAQARQVAEAAAKGNPKVAEMLEKSDARRAGKLAEAAKKAEDSAIAKSLGGLEAAVKKEADNATKVAANQEAVDLAAANPYTQSAIDYALKNIEKKAGKGKGQGVLREIWNLDKTPTETKKLVDEFREYGSPVVNLRKELAKAQEAGNAAEVQKLEKEIAEAEKNWAGSSGFRKVAQELQAAAERGGLEEPTPNDWARTMQAMKTAEKIPGRILGGVGVAGLLGAGAANTWFPGENDTLPASQESFINGGLGVTTDSGKPIDNGEIKGPSGGHGPITQREEYYNFLNSDESELFREMFPQYADLETGYSALRGSGDMDAWAYLTGLDTPGEGIDGWYTRYLMSGVDMRDEDKAIDNLRDYLYGNDAVNIVDYMMGNSDVRLANDADAIAETAKYLQDVYNWNFDPAFAEKYNLDANDIATAALAAQVSANGWNGLNIDQVNQILADSGEGGHFKRVKADSDLYNANKWREVRDKSYGSNIYDGAYTPYSLGNDAYLLDQDITGYLMAMYNDAHPDDKIILSFD